ncbi:DUF4143 domain-containing protein [Myceligenerans halotolerans]
MAYIRRAVDNELSEILQGLPAVAVEGPKGVGKTATASQYAKSVIALDDPDQADLLALDPGRLSRMPSPTLIDEWQIFPRSWDLVRRAVDSGAAPGSFILTGSASPRERTHSGAGRIVRVRMRPMGFDERELARPTVSFAQLIGDEPAEMGGESSITLADYADEIVRSGFPGIRGIDGRNLTRALDGYLARIVDHDFEELGHEVRRPEALRAWLTAFAAATGSTASYESILDAAAPGLADKPSRSASLAYRDTLSRLWILDQIPAWVGSRSRMTPLAASPKHYLADPGLAARLLGVSSAALIDEAQPGTMRSRDGILLGALFEHLVALTVRVHAETHGCRVLHLRTKNGANEVDLIVERDDGRVLAIEVKLAPVPREKDVRHLRWLKEKLGSDLVDAVVVTTGQLAYRREDDGIAVVPLALLGP